MTHSFSYRQMKNFAVRATIYRIVFRFVRLKVLSLNFCCINPKNRSGGNRTHIPCFTDRFFKYCRLNHKHDCVKYTLTIELRYEKRLDWTRTNDTIVPLIVLIAVKFTNMNHLHLQYALPTELPTAYFKTFCAFNTARTFSSIHIHLRSFSFH